MKRLTLIQSDGGRSHFPRPGGPRDCAVRAIANGTCLPYRTVWGIVDEENSRDRITRGRRLKGKLRADQGVRSATFRRLMLGLGWQWTPTMFIGSGCRVHLRADELPHEEIICTVSRHVCYVDNREGKGLLYDTHDCTRDGTRCVYGFWRKPL